MNHYEEQYDRQHDAVNHPKHYTGHPSGVECIQITEHMGFNLGNAVKYIWRCDLKRDAIEDLRKAAWYIEREISKRELAHKQSRIDIIGQNGNEGLHYETQNK